MHCLIFVTVWCGIDYDAKMSSLSSPAHAEDPVICALSILGEQSQQHFLGTGVGLLTFNYCWGGVRCSDMLVLVLKSLFVRPDGRLKKD